MPARGIPGTAEYTKLEAHAAAVTPALAGYPPGCCPPRDRCPDRSRRHRRGGCGFAVTEQLGLALGNPTVTDITVPILTEKSDHHLQLQELLLEMAAKAILYHRDT